MSTNAETPQLNVGASRFSTRSALRAMHVLVAEDGLINQQLARRLLAEAGCCVTVVANGREAVCAARRTSYDAIIMDIEMPEMDGLTATRHIRRWEEGQGRRTPIIGWTATAQEAECLDAGMDAVLEKPLDAAALSALVKQLVHSDAA